MSRIIAHKNEIMDNRMPSMQSLLIMREVQQAVLLGERSLLIRRFMKPQLRSAQYAYIEAARKWKIAQGDLSVEILHESWDEIGELADSFRKMAANLRKRTRDLTEARVHAHRAPAYCVCDALRRDRGQR